MKRLASVLLLLSLFLSAVSCAKAPALTAPETAAQTANAGEKTADLPQTNGPRDPEGFAVGFSRHIMTPEIPTPLAGAGRTSQRYYTRILDPITVSCVAISDGENKALLITQDLIRCNKDITDQARRQLSRLSGIPAENIFIASTHTHASVDPSSTEDAVTLWKAIYYREIKGACSDALADLDSAAVRIGRTQTEGLTYVRRFLLKDGTLLGPNSGTAATPENPIVAYESEADRELQLIRFVRKNKKDVVLANFQAHATLTGNSQKFDLSADYVYPFRREVEKKADVHCAFFLGASGNQNPTSRIESEPKHSDYIEHGTLLASYALDLLKNGMEDAETGAILVENRIFTAVCDHSRDNEVEKANEIYNLWNANRDAEAKELCKKYGFASPYSAGSVLSKSKRGESEEMELCALSFGDVSFLTAGFEMFSGTQLSIKEKTPFKMTFILTCSQNAFSYMPTLDAFPHGAYEVDSCHFVPGTAELLRDAYLEMLTSLYAK